MRHTRGARWQGSVYYFRIYNSFAVFWMVVFSIAWYQELYFGTEHIRTVIEFSDSQIEKFLDDNIKQRILKKSRMCQARARVNKS